MLTDGLAWPRVAHRALARDGSANPVGKLAQARQKKHRVNILPPAFRNFHHPKAMRPERPPTIDLAAAERWLHRPAPMSPWLHEEVARRMEQRLAWIKLQPARWAHWAPSRGGVQGHALLAQRYPSAECYVVEPTPAQALATNQAMKKPWWNAARWVGKGAITRFETPPPQSVQMLWANMALHMAADPQTLISTWHKALAVDGFLMFSCLGPDTLREIRTLYQRLGWPAPSHEFTDMHDWGDMLVAAGFAEPVLDMERIVLSFETPQRLLTELRGLGRNLHPARFEGLRGRGWQQKLQHALRDGLREGLGQGLDAPLTLTFEVIYGHAFKPARRLAVRPETSLSLGEMRKQLNLR